MACGSCGSRAAKATYEYKSADGKTQVFSTEQEARAAVARRGGSYKTQK